MAPGGKLLLPRTLGKQGCGFKKECGWVCLATSLGLWDLGGKTVGPVDLYYVFFSPFHFRVCVCVWGGNLTCHSNSLSDQSQYVLIEEETSLQTLPSGNKSKEVKS